MPHIGIMGTALTTHLPRVYGLFVGGTDVIEDPVSKRYGVPLESIEVTEEGPGAVSSMSFTVDDPGKLLAIVPGMEVRFEKFGTFGLPYFLGYVQQVTIRPDFGDTGRSFDVECIGIEALLDWTVIGTDLVIVSPDWFPIPGMIMAAAVGMGAINYTMDASGENGDRDTPVTGRIPSNAGPTVTIPAGTTVREALRMATDTVTGPLGMSYLVTIDCYRGLRIWRTDDLDTNTEKPADYPDEVITNDTTGATLVTEDLRYATDMGTTHIVFIKGSNAAGTGFVNDGSGQPGMTAYIEDATSDTAAKLQAKGAAYLKEFQSAVRGSYRQSDRITSTLPPHGGTILVLTDARAGLSAARLRIMTVTKRFHDGPDDRQDYDVSFGGNEPSMVNMVRRLTRTIRS